MDDPRVFSAIQQLMRVLEETFHPIAVTILKINSNQYEVRIEMIEGDCKFVM